MGHAWGGQHTHTHTQTGKRERGEERRGEERRCACLFT
jgi:hypothetical protein